MQHWTDAAFIGGHPALDFVNTVDDQDKERAQDRIADWPSFTAWAAASGLFDRAAQTRLKAEADKIGAAAGLNAIRHLREAAYGVLSALAAGEAPPGAARRELEAVIKKALAEAELTLTDEGALWAPARAEKDWVRQSLALAIEDLLRSPALPRLRECGRCSWLFLDQGRGAGRRWCSMKTCGNRAKAEAFRQKA